MLTPSRPLAILSTVQPLRSLVLPYLLPTTRSLTTSLPRPYPPRSRSRGPNGEKIKPAISSYTKRQKMYLEQNAPRDVYQRITSPEAGDNSGAARRGMPASMMPTSSRRLATLDRERAPHQIDRTSGHGPKKWDPSIRSRITNPTPKPLTDPFPISASAKTPDNIAAAGPRPFTAFPLHPGLLQPLHESFGSGGQTTPVQSLSLGHLLGISPSSATPVRALLGGETGSGKTLAYLLPLFHHLKFTDKPRDPDAPTHRLLPRAVVLSPTHELTRQITGVAKSLCHTVKLSVMGLSSTSGAEGGGRRGEVDVLCGTAGRVAWGMGMGKWTRDEGGREGVDHGGHGWIGTERVEWVVVDEADVLLGPDFRDSTLRLLSHLAASNAKLNILLVTATLPPSLLTLLQTERLLSTPSPFTQLLSPAMHKLPKNLTTRFVPSSGGSVFADIAHEVRRVFADDAREGFATGDGGGGEGGEEAKSKVVIFCNSDEKVRRVAATLKAKEIDCLAWTGEGGERIRGKNGDLDMFLVNPKSPRPSVAAPPTTTTKGTTAEEPRVLVTTSLLSRGLDFSPLVSSVFLVDQPRDVLDFVHRAGRAGRAGRKGRVVVFGMGTGLGLRTGGVGQLGKEVGGVMRARERSGERVGPGGRIQRRRVAAQ